jgi:hypothetical protein
MTIAAERLVANVPGRMESCSLRRALTHPQCILQEPSPEGFHSTMCDAVHHDDRKLKIRSDAATYKLNLAFMHAHGTLTGEVTTFSNLAAETGSSRPGK